MPVVAGVVILLQEAGEFVAIQPPPAGPQAGEKFEFADGRNRHANPLRGNGETPGYFLCMPENSQLL
jgi:hypothetical protein